MQILHILLNLNLNNILYFSLILILWLLISIKFRKHFFRFIKETFLDFSGYFKFSFITLLFFIILCFYSVYLPLSYDESYTFLNFVNKNIFYAVATYPAPNNHVLHSILANISWHIFKWTHLETFVRLPSIICSCLILNVFITRNSKKEIFYTSAFFIALLYNFYFFQYSFQARGYSMQILFAVLSLLCLLEDPRINFKTRNGRILLYSLLGLYTSPSYLYVFIPLYLIFILQNTKQSAYLWKYITISIIYFGLTLILLYSPIIIYSGYENIISNSHLIPPEDITIAAVIKYTYYTFVIIHSNSIFGIVILTLFTIFIIKEKKYYFLLLFIIPFLLMLILKQMPYPRVCLPLGIIMLFYVIENSNNHILLPSFLYNKIFICSTVLILTLGLFYLFVDFDNCDLDSSDKVKKMKVHFYKEKVYLDPATHWYLKAPVESYLSISGKPYEIINNSTVIPENSVIVFSDKNKENITLVDSAKSMDSQVYTGKANCEIFNYTYQHTH